MKVKFATVNVHNTTYGESKTYRRNRNRRRVMIVYRVC